jgi:hypothetical protein
MAEIKTTDGSLYFCTHGTGSDLPTDAQVALDKAQNRIDDVPYALRIVVDALIAASGARDSETGASLMLGPDAEDSYNDDRPSVVIDLVHNEVRTTGHSQEASNV